MDAAFTGEVDEVLLDDELLEVPLEDELSPPPPPQAANKVKDTIIR